MEMNNLTSLPLFNLPSQIECSDRKVHRLQTERNVCEGAPLLWNFSCNLSGNAVLRQDARTISRCTRDRNGKNVARQSCRPRYRT